MAGEVVVGTAVVSPVTGRGEGAVESLLAVGVAPDWRGAGLASAMLRALVESRPAGVAMEVAVGTAERDAVDPVPVETRMAVARRLLEGAGFAVRAPSPDISRDDQFAIAARLAPR